MSKPADPTKAIIYCRVSTQKQVDHGVSLDAQKAACLEYARFRKLEVLSVHHDKGISGRKDEGGRPGLAEVIAAHRANPDAVVVVYSLSRLGRSQRDVWRLLDDRGEVGLRVASATEPFETSTAMGRAMLGMLATFNQLTSDLASEQTVAALAYAKSVGTKLGAPSMIESTDEDGNRFIDPRKVDLVRTVQDLRATTPLSLREIADRLNSEGVPSAKGKRWHPRTVQVALATQLPP